MIFAYEGKNCFNTTITIVECLACGSKHVVTPKIKDIDKYLTVYTCNCGNSNLLDKSNDEIIHFDGNKIESL